MHKHFLSQIRLNKEEFAEKVTWYRNRVFTALELLVVGFVVYLFGAFSGVISASHVEVAVAAAPATAPAEVAGPISAAGPAAISPLFNAEVQHWAESITRWAGVCGLDPNLVALVMQIESCGDPVAVSSAGALGLFQVMPFHFEEGEDPLDPETNARRGLSYLVRSLELAQGDIGLALAGYNGGHGTIGMDSSEWSEETRRYYYWGTGVWADIQAKAQSSARLEEWLAAGGASLCRQAAAVQSQ